MKRVVMFSGGIGSWAAAKRVAAHHGTADLTLLFADTMMEDEDLYRFLDEGAASVGVPVTRIADGRTPWEVFTDKRFLGNSRVDPCSQILKRELCATWLTENCDPADTVVSTGVDWTEMHRHDREPGTNGPKDPGGIKQRYAALGWTYDAPMCSEPYLSKSDMLRWLRAEGIRPPKLYELGFSHNNCGGFCIKAGHGHFALLLKTMPERYAFHEAKEQEIRALLGDVSILSDRTGDNIKKPLTLREFRERIEMDWQPDLFDIGGCGCFVDEPASPAAPQEK